MSEILTADQLGKFLNLTARRVRQLKAEGILTTTEPNRYELIPSLHAYIRYLRDCVSRFSGFGIDFGVESGDGSVQGGNQEPVDFTVGLLSSLAGPTALAIKDLTKGRVDPDLIWRILDLQFVLAMEILGRMIGDEDFTFELPSAFEKLADPKGRKGLIRWLSKQKITPIKATPAPPSRAREK